jgi:hypothetical protein
MTDKIIVYKDEKNYYIPTTFIGYGGMVEVNGLLLDKPSSSNYIITSRVTSIRMATRKELPTKYIHGDEEMSAVDYDARIEYLSRNFKEKIDEKYDDDGERMNVCIWKDKDAEKEFYRLTNKFQCVYKPIVVYGDWIDFEFVTLPKSPSEFIIPDWKISEKLVLTCLFTRNKMLNNTIDSLTKQYPLLNVKNYCGNSEPCIYINDTRYNITGISRYNGGTFRGTLTECVDEQNRLLVELTGYFNIEIGKTKSKQLANVTVVLEDINAALRKFQFVKTKVATERQYREGIALLNSLKNKLEEEIKS